MRRKSGSGQIGEDLRKIARSRVTAAIKSLGQDNHVHQTRRTLKSLQSLLVLIRPEIGETAHLESSGLLYAVSKALAAQRLLEAMGEMAEKMLEVARTGTESDAVAGF